ncbi:unnamed protein product [Sphagnum troendelagicum]|uniref:Protein kinase domain-containing protein n=1 Tax=Sphagnum troendelagicum TaxID=128251 RepID=A0ABP0U8A8_9BRYO
MIELCYTIFFAMFDSTIGKLREQDVAVKKVLETTTHNLEEFINEVALITNVSKHKNLVKFLDKIDVYSFRVVILELVIGTKCLDTNFSSSDINIVNRVGP